MGEGEMEGYKMLHEEGMDIVGVIESGGVQLPRECCREEGEWRGATGMDIA